MFEVTIKKMFSAAHMLTEIGGICEKLHGHNFVVEVTVASEELNPEGIILDFRYLKQRTNEILDTLDHKCLNELPEFKNRNPSSEYIAKYIYDRLTCALEPGTFFISKVTVWESEDARVTYRRSAIDRK